MLQRPDVLGSVEALRLSRKRSSETQCQQGGNIGHQLERAPKNRAGEGERLWTAHEMIEKERRDGCWWG